MAIFPHSPKQKPNQKRNNKDHSNYIQESGLTSHDHENCLLNLQHACSPNSQSACSESAELMDESSTKSHHPLLAFSQAISSAWRRPIPRSIWRFRPRLLAGKSAKLASKAASHPIQAGLADSRAHLRLRTWRHAINRRCRRRNYPRRSAKSHSLLRLRLQFPCFCFLKHCCCWLVGWLMFDCLDGRRRRL
jgi:hypothetical protein